MSRTLFRYIFKDLLKIFLMASGALAGIMSFGGMLRPLTQSGLDGAQVALLMRYFMPAMSTYSLPVSVLFATTWVYGRLSADNEVTACRAGGISSLSLAGPAVLLGAVVSAASVYLLCFTVPNATRQVEQVVYSNLAKLIANEITQKHETNFNETTTVYGDSAELPPPDPAHPDEQAVVIYGPLFVSVYAPPGKPAFYQVPKQFWSANRATVHIKQAEDGSAAVSVNLDDGTIIPREFDAVRSNQGGIATAVFGPTTIPSRVGQKTKFMDVLALHRLKLDPSRGERVRAMLEAFIREDQGKAIGDPAADGLRGADRRCDFRAATGDAYGLSAAAGLAVDEQGVVTTVGPFKPPAGKPATAQAVAVVRGVTFEQREGNQVRLSAVAAAARVTVDADTPNRQAVVTVELRDAVVNGGDAATDSFARKFVVPLPPAVADMGRRTAENYLNTNLRDPRARTRLLFEWVDLLNHIAGEYQSRAAFVVSCLFLGVVGACLGMMFRSGNFLTAFAVSVVPAMLSTVLIVTGQHTVEATNYDHPAFAGHVVLGTMLIWSGNVVIAAAGVGLLWRLQRR